MQRLLIVSAMALSACGASSDADKDGDGGAAGSEQPSRGGASGSAGAAGGSAGGAGESGTGGSGGSAGGSGGSTGGSAGSTSGSGGRAGSAGNGVGGAAGSSGRCTVLAGRLRDFQPETHPDFEPQDSNIPGHVEGKEPGPDLGIVAPALGADGTPVYAGPADGTPTTTGPANFEHWFHDTPLNLGIRYEIALEDADGDGLFVFDRSGAGGFLPIDDNDPEDNDNCPPAALQPDGFTCLFGNSLQFNGIHNYHMTFEIHARFVHRPGTRLTFEGDDDTWIFLDETLALDLGGLHMAQRGDVLLDELALEAGRQYRLDLFWAERQGVDSNFALTTDIEFIDCGD